jgi:addiction module HigA family antidote
MKNPIHPGRIIREDYLEPLNMSSYELANKLGISSQQLTSILNEKANITSEIAESLSNFFETTPDLWINMQANFDKK